MHRFDGRLLLTLLLAAILAVCLPPPSSAAEEGANGAPVILEHPLDTIVPKGDPVTLNCKAQGNPPPQITWYKDGEAVSTAVEESSSHRVLLPAGSLFFLRVHSAKSGKPPDSGTYWCVARNSKGETRSHDAQLRIAMLRDDFRARPKNVQASVGQQAILECSPPRGFPEPVVSWEKDNRVLRPDDDERLTVHSSGNLIIKPVRKGDSGFYTCVARNMVDTKESNAARLSVYEKPRFERRPDDSTADVGSDVLFACQVSGDPMPVIVWRKKLGKMPLGRAQILESKGLRIDRVLPTDEGEFICQAKNPAGSIEASARLTVHAPPSFSEQPRDQTVQEGGSAGFECDAVGNPPPARFWSKEGEQELMFPGHVSGDGRLKVTADGVLQLVGVRIADQGYYVCSALNAAGSNIAKAYLKVSALVAQPPPIITQGPANQTLPFKTLANLPCKAVGHSRPHVSWLKNSRPIAEDSRYTLMTTGTLQVHDLRQSDSAVYTCQAKNADGETSWSASLQVALHTDPHVVFHRMDDPSTYPSAPGKPRARNMTETSALLSWSKPTKEGASPVSGYILQYFSPELGQTWFSAPDHIGEPQYTMRELRAASSYVFLVRAENDEGIGEPSAMSAIVRTVGSRLGDTKPVGSDFDLDLARTRLTAEQLVKLQEVKTVNSTAMRLFWRQRHHEPLVQGYYIKWQGPAASGGERSWINVTSAATSTQTVGSLRPYTTYTFFVTPYYRSVEGLPSNSLDGTTAESPPSAPPSDIHVRMMNMSTLRISWRPPPPRRINGLLRGYRVLVLAANDSRLDRNITTNERAASITLFHLRPRATYRLRVAAVTGAGPGVSNRPIVLTMDHATLKKHLAMDVRQNSGDGLSRLLRALENPWVIVIGGFVLWVALFILIFLIWWSKKRAGKKTSQMGNFIKINDGSVMVGREAHGSFWEHVAFNTAQRNAQNGSGTLGSQRQHYESGYLMDSSPPPDYPALNGTGRRHSPHQCPQLSQQNLSSFHPAAMRATDSPSPYATTTLVMDTHRQNLLNEQLQQRRRHGAPVDKSNSASLKSDSPPNTDISYVHSAGQSARSTAARDNAAVAGSANSGGVRAASKPMLLDFLPPPPECPPPAAPLPPARAVAASAPTRRRHDTEGDYDYETLNDMMMRSFRSSSPLDDALLHDGADGTACSPMSSHCDAPLPPLLEGGTSAASSDGDDDCAVTSRLSPEPPDADLFERRRPPRSARSLVHVSRRTPSAADDDADAAYGARPAQPCMGVSASALTQSTCEACVFAAARKRGSFADDAHRPARTGSSQRLRSMPRHSNQSSLRDLV